MKKSTYVLIYGILVGILLCAYGWYVASDYLIFIVTGIPTQGPPIPLFLFPELFFLDPVLLLLATLPESLQNWAVEAEWRSFFLAFSLHFITGFLVGTLIGNLHYRLAQLPKEKI